MAKSKSKLIAAVQAIIKPAHIGDTARYIEDGNGVAHPVEDQEARAIAEKKVDKEDGKGLSANNFTDALKAKLESVEDNANKTEIDKKLSPTSNNALINKAIYELFSKHLGADFKAQKEENYIFKCIYGYTNSIPETPDYGESWGTFTCKPDVYWNDLKDALDEYYPNYTIEGMELRNFGVEEYDVNVHTERYRADNDTVCIENGKIKYLYLHTYGRCEFDSSFEYRLTITVEHYEHSVASVDKAGFLSASDKAKLDELIVDVFALATAQAEGKAGYVPAPPAGSQSSTKLLTSKGVWTGSIPLFDFGQLNIGGERFANENGIAPDFVSKLSPMSRAEMPISSPVALSGDDYIKLADFYVDILDDNYYFCAEISVNLVIDKTFTSGSGYYWDKPFRFALDMTHRPNFSIGISEGDQISITLHKPSTKVEYNNMSCDKIVVLRQAVSDNRYIYGVYVHINFDSSRTMCNLVHAAVNVLNYTCTDPYNMTEGTVQAKAEIVKDISSYETKYTHNIKFE